MGIFGIRRSKLSEVMGINRRNLDYIYPHNPRAQFALADDKIRAKEILAGAGLPVPPTLAAVRYRSEIPICLERIRKESGCAIKPARSYGGQGLLVLRKSPAGEWRNFKDQEVTEETISFHMAAILSGLFALGSEIDCVLVEVLLRDCAAFREIHGTTGVSDVRVIVLRGTPVLAMLRLPTQVSHGAANLHAGGLGVGIDLATGRTTHAIQRRRPVERHPDSGVWIAGREIPFWAKILEYSKPINALFGMDYMGVDFVVDETRGPLLLEVNVRPGLDIQLANRKGLLAAIGERTSGSEQRP